jgi:hypothetical protein
VLAVGQTDRFAPAAVLGHMGLVVSAFVPAGYYPWTLQNSFKIKASPLGDLHAHCEPLDTEAVLRAARETPGIVTAEVATVAGRLTACTTVGCLFLLSLISSG